MQAKGFAIAERHVFYCTLHAFIYFLESNDDRRKMLTRCKYLFLDGFEKDFRSEEVPYTLYQRMEVEDFLKARIDAGLVNNFAACRRWGQLRWWSADFINGMTSYVRDIALV